MAKWIVFLIGMCVAGLFFWFLASRLTTLLSKTICHFRRPKGGTALQGQIEKLHESLEKGLFMTPEEGKQILREIGMSISGDLYSITPESHQDGEHDAFEQHIEEHRQFVKGQKPDFITHSPLTDFTIKDFLSE